MDVDPKPCKVAGGKKEAELKVQIDAAAVILEIFILYHTAKGK